MAGEAQRGAGTAVRRLRARWLEPSPPLAVDDEPVLGAGARPGGRGRRRGGAARGTASRFLSAGLRPGETGHARAMIRALTTLVGLACAAALLLLVPDMGAADGGGLWKRAALLAAAGLVAGAFYQLGGIRRPGVQAQPAPAARGLPARGRCSPSRSARSARARPSSLTDLVRDILPDSALRRWSLSFPILAFTSGLLLAFALVEPRVGERPAEPEVVAETETIDAAEPAPPLETVRA